MLDIRYELTSEKKTKPDYNKLGFGQYFTDHMFLMNYSTERAGTMPASSPTVPSLLTLPAPYSTTHRSFLRA